MIYHLDDHFSSIILKITGDQTGEKERKRSKILCMVGCNRRDCSLFRHRLMGFWDSLA